VLIALVMIPLLAGALALLIPSNRLRPWIVPVSALAHTVLTVLALWVRPAVPAGAWLGLDPLGSLVLAEVSSLYLVCALYIPSYLVLREDRDNRVFTGAITALLGTLSAAILSRHIGLMWVGLETSALAGAPLIYFNRNRRSIEATWKYLLIGGVGVALALLGSFFLAYAALYVGQVPSLFFDDLSRTAGLLSKPWLHAALVLLFIGYGTKMGLAPMHTWKPDAYGEAPGAVGALFAGCVTSAAFLAILRAFRLAALAGDAPFARQLLLALGLLSMLVAGVFMVRQDDFKRMLAYSSVEHMGIMVLGVALGGAGVFGGLFHMINNGFSKGVMFLGAGNIHRAYDSKLASRVHGALTRVPVSAGLLLAGFFAVTGAPPFGPFMSELTILQAALSQGRVWVAAVFLLLLLLVFVGMGLTVLHVVQGEPPAEEPAHRFRDSLRTTLPIALMLGVSLLLGLYLPPPVRALLEQAAAYVEGR